MPASSGDGGGGEDKEIARKYNTKCHKQQGRTGRRRREACYSVGNILFHLRSASALKPSWKNFTFNLSSSG